MQYPSSGALLGWGQKASGIGAVRVGCAPHGSASAVGVCAGVIFVILGLECETASEPELL